MMSALKSMDSLDLMKLNNKVGLKTGSTSSRHYKENWIRVYLLSFFVCLFFVTIFHIKIYTKKYLKTKTSMHTND